MNNSKCNLTPTKWSPECILSLTENELMLIEQGLKKNEAYLKGKYDKLSKETKENNSRVLRKVMIARAELALKGVK